MRRALVVVALALAGCGGEAFSAGLFADAGGDVGADAQEGDGQQLGDAGGEGEASADDARPDREHDSGRADSAPDTSADSGMVGADADAGDVADVTAADAFDGCVTTAGGWCAAGGSYHPCGAGLFTCGGASCTGGCAAGQGCTFVTGIGSDGGPTFAQGVVTTCAP